jgi:hypothetical protein
MSAVLSIAKLIYAVAGLFDRLVAYLSQSRSIQAGEDKAAARSLKEQTDRVRQARAARRAVDTRGLPDDDPYLRD